MFSQAILFILPASLVVALEKFTFLGLPVYFLEALFLVFIIVQIPKLREKKFRDRWRNVDRVLVLGGALFVVGAAVATLSQGQLVSPTSLGQLKSWFFFPAIVAITFYTLQEGKRQERRLFYGGWLVGVTIVALTALYGYGQGLLTYDERLAFPYNSPNFLALIVAPGILLATFFLHQVRGWPKRAFLLSLQGLFFTVLYLSHSYNAWGSLILASFMTFAILGIQKVGSKHAYKLTGFVVAGALLLGGLFLLEQGSNKWENLLLENGRSSLDSRVMIWQSGLMILKDHWFVGIGVGNFQPEYLVYQKYFKPYLEWSVPQPHNLLLAVWLQAGLLGLCGFILMVYRIMSRLYKRMQRRGSNEGILLLGLWLLFLGYGLIDTPYFRNDLAFLFWSQILLTYWYVEEKEPL